MCDRIVYFAHVDFPLTLPEPVESRSILLAAQIKEEEAAPDPAVA